MKRTECYSGKLQPCSPPGFLLLWDAQISDMRLFFDTQVLWCVMCLTVERPLLAPRVASNTNGSPNCTIQVDYRHLSLRHPKQNDSMISRLIPTLILLNTVLECKMKRPITWLWILFYSQLYTGYKICIWLCSNNCRGTDMSSFEEMEFKLIYTFVWSGTLGQTKLWL